MKQRLKAVMLIDDDEPTNFLNELIVTEADCTERIITLQGGKAALDYIKSKQGQDHVNPDLIFLDVNMPAMNGWEFLEEYILLSQEQKGKTVIVMLTTSLNPEDEDKAKTYSEVKEFCPKPLTLKLVANVLKRHFNINLKNKKEWPL